jgi:hypothetical protein
MMKFSIQLQEFVMKTVVSKSAAVLFALTLGCGMAYGAMGERCGSSNPPAEKCNAGKKSFKANHCGSAPKCGEAKEQFKKQHCGSGKASEGKPKSDAKCGKGKCG